MSDCDSEAASISSEDGSNTSESFIGDNEQNMSNRDSDIDEHDSQLEPYQDEPLTPPDYEEQDQGNDDPDGIRPQTLAEREDRVIESW